MPGVFNWILDGLKRLSMQGKFTENENAKKALNEAREQSDVVLQFLNDEYIRPGTKAECRAEIQRENTITFDGEKLKPYELKLESIYNYFKTYCIDNGYKPIANKTLKKRMQLYKYDFEKTRDGQVTWVYWIGSNDKGQNFMHRPVKVEDKPPFNDIAPF
jgi:putative DNA primase/helicase